MASLNTDRTGNRRLQFKAPSGKRVTLYLGKLPLRQAQTVKSNVERLIIAAVSGDNLDSETAAWLTRITTEVHGKLATAGLVSKRHSARLEDFLDSYVKSRADVKGSTAIVYGHTRRCLLDYFGLAKPLRDITPGDATEWCMYLASDQKLAPNTVRRRCGIAKQFFNHAVKKQLIDRNPFSELKAAVRGNVEKFRFIDHATTQRIIDTCPDAEWRALVALARYGGLRCPSETLTLTWDRIDWERGRMTVYSPKTEHHEGGAYRDVPLFPELRPYLEELWELATPGENRVVTRYVYNGQNTNLRTQFQKIIKRAGVEPWPKLWQNLRSSRETELTESFPLHVVVAWIGNSAAVAQKHYLQVTDDHFAEAAAGDSETATHNPTYMAHVQGRKASSKKGGRPVFPGKYGPLLTCTSVQVGDEGLEPPTSTV